MFANHFNSNTEICSCATEHFCIFPKDFVVVRLAHFSHFRLMDGEQFFIRQIALLELHALSLSAKAKLVEIYCDISAITLFRVYLHFGESRARSI